MYLTGREKHANGKFKHLGVGKHVPSVAAPGFRFGGGSSDRISYMNSSQVLYCNGVAKISVGERAKIQLKCTHKRLLKNL